MNKVSALIYVIVFYTIEASAECNYQQTNARKIQQAFNFPCEQNNVKRSYEVFNPGTSVDICWNERTILNFRSNGEMHGYIIHSISLVLSNEKKLPLITNQNQLEPYNIVDDINNNGRILLFATIFQNDSLTVKENITTKCGKGQSYAKLFTQSPSEKRVEIKLISPLVANSEASELPEFRIYRNPSAMNDPELYDVLKGNDVRSEPFKMQPNSPKQYTVNYLEPGSARMNSLPSEYELSTETTPQSLQDLITKYKKMKETQSPETRYYGATTFRSDTTPLLISEVTSATETTRYQNIKQDKVGYEVYSMFSTSGGTGSTTFIETQSTPEMERVTEPPPSTVFLSSSVPRTDESTTPVTKSPASKSTDYPTDKPLNSEPVVTTNRKLDEAYTDDLKSDNFDTDYIGSEELPSREKEGPTGEKYYHSSVSLIKPKEKVELWSQPVQQIKGKKPSNVGKPDRPSWSNDQFYGPGYQKNHEEGFYMPANKEPYLKGYGPDWASFQINQLNNEQKEKQWPNNDLIKVPNRVFTGQETTIKGVPLLGHYITQTGHPTQKLNIPLRQQNTQDESYYTNMEQKPVLYQNQNIIFDKNKLPSLQNAKTHNMDEQYGKQPYLKEYGPDLASFQINLLNNEQNKGVLPLESYLSQNGHTPQGLNIPIRGQNTQDESYYTSIEEQPVLQQNQKLIFDKNKLPSLQNIKTHNMDEQYPPMYLENLDSVINFLNKDFLHKAVNVKISILNVRCDGKGNSYMKLRISITRDNGLVETYYKYVIVTANDLLDRGMNTRTSIQNHFRSILINYHKCDRSQLSHHEYKNSYQNLPAREIPQIFGVFYVGSDGGIRVFLPPDVKKNSPNMRRKIISAISNRKRPLQWRRVSSRWFHSKPLWKSRLLNTSKEQELKEEHSKEENSKEKSKISSKEESKISSNEEDLKEQPKVSSFLQDMLQLPLKKLEQIKSSVQQILTIPAWTSRSLPVEEYSKEKQVAGLLQDALKTSLWKSRSLTTSGADSSEKLSFLEDLMKIPTWRSRSLTPFKEDSEEQQAKSLLQDVLNWKSRSLTSSEEDSEEKPKVPFLQTSLWKSRSLEEDSKEKQVKSLLEEVLKTQLGKSRSLTTFEEDSNGNPKIFLQNLLKTPWKSRSLATSEEDSEEKPKVSFLQDFLKTQLWKSRSVTPFEEDSKEEQGNQDVLETPVWKSRSLTTSGEDSKKSFLQNMLKTLLWKSRSLRPVEKDSNSARSFLEYVMKGVPEDSDFAEKKKE